VSANLQCLSATQNASAKSAPPKIRYNQLIFIFMAGILIFILTTMFKAIQFTLTATNLYKKMINREDLVIKLLLDIRGNTKTTKIDDLQKLESMAAGATSSRSIYCPSCEKSDGYRDALGNAFCPNCRKVIA
jgi:hypothetical protein